MKALQLPNGQQGESGARQVEAVRRATEVLSLFVDAPNAEGVSVGDAALALEVNKSTASRLLSTLAASGFVLLDPNTHRYHVGPMAFALGSHFAGAQLARSCAPIVKSLSDQTGCTAQMGTLQSNMVIYLVVVQPQRTLRVVAEAGDMRYAHGSSMGKAILASLPNAAIDAFIQTVVQPSGLLPPSGPNTIIEPVRFLRELEVIRRNGYGLSEEETTAGVSAIGVHVPSHSSFPCGVGVQFPKGSFSPDEYGDLAALVLKAAQDIAVLMRPQAHTS